MSKIIDFYLNNKEIDDLVSKSDEYWDARHDLIQWVFPLNVPSNFNPDAPILTDDDIFQFHVDNEIKENFYKLFDRFMEFLGLEAVIDTDENAWEVKKGFSFNDKQILWKIPNHNWLRITRLLSFLHLMGWNELKTTLFNCLHNLYNEGYASENSYLFWYKAASPATTTV